MTTVLVHRQRSPPSDKLAKVSEANASALEAEQWKLGHQAVVPPGVERDHHGVNHEKSLHACGHDPQGPPAGMPRSMAVACVSASSVSSLLSARCIRCLASRCAVSGLSRAAVRPLEFNPRPLRCSILESAA